MLNFVEEIDKHVLFSRLKENDYLEDLVKEEHPSIYFDADWIRIPLPESTTSIQTTAIVGASSGWPTSLDSLVDCLKKGGVLFTDEDQIISVFCGGKSSGKWENQGIF